MKPLAHRLKRRGFNTYCYRYYSTKDDISSQAKGLMSYIDTIGVRRVHFVAHSLGGLVVRHFLYTYFDYPVGRLVTLGTPHLGSITAQYAKKFFPLSLGKAFDNGLDGNCPPLAANIELGSIAGNRSFGLGQILLSRHNKISQQFCKHDGTVYVFETALPNAIDHIILPVSHTNMLISKEVAKQTAHFLKTGAFLH